MYSTPKQLSFRTELKNCLNARNLLTAKSKFKGYTGLIDTLQLK